MALEAPVIIVGGGIVGLTLAQALKQHSIPFEVYERDAQIDRAKGWGITIHWALPALRSCLPQFLFQKISTIQVDPQQGIKDTGRFVFLDLSTTEPRYVIPPSERYRINRLKFRALLAEGIDIHWNRRLKDFETTDDDQIRVTFTDGSTTKGSLLVGADGSGSKTRRLVMDGDRGELNQLPVRFMGVTVRLTPEEVKPLRDIDPLLFQGCHPDTGAYLWYSTLSTPEVNGSTSPNEYYEGQLNMSWVVKSPEDEVPPSNRERVAKMKHMAIGFESRLLKAINDIPDDSEVLEIKLQDWPTLDWPNHDGRVTIIGDAAHAMTMYRGEAANHGITDAASLCEKLVSVKEGKISRKQAVDDFQKQLIDRTHNAVLWSRQACLDAHDLNGLRPDSPLVSKRSTFSEPGVKVVRV